jgi:valyl-tRNA synthetase
VAKTRVQDPAAQPHVLAVQDLVIREFLLLFAPFAPFITEELWRLLGYGGEGEFLQSTRIGTSDGLLAQLASLGIRIDSEATARVETLKQVTSLARQLKADQAVAQKRDVSFHVLAGDAEWSLLAASTAKVTRLVGAASLLRTADKPAFPAMVTPLGTLFLDTGIKVDAAAERLRLTKELDLGQQTRRRHGGAPVERGLCQQSPPGCARGRAQTARRPEGEAG